MDKYITLLEGEQFKPFPDNPNYLISNKGRVFSTLSKQRYNPKPNGLMKPSLGNIGYLHSTLWIESRGFIRYGIHRLVATTFIPNPENLPEVHHIDHDKTNNDEVNLKWVTHQENIKYSFESGNRKILRGIDHPNYGKVRSDKAKKLMSRAKIGRLHPKFKGYYIIHGQQYESANQAGKILGIPPITITRRVKSHTPGYTFQPVDIHPKTR